MGGVESKLSEEMNECLFITSFFSSKIRYFVLDENYI